MPFNLSWPLDNCGPTACARALKHVHYLGVRERDIEEIIVNPRRHELGTIVTVRIKIKNVADREQDHNGSNAQ